MKIINHYLIIAVGIASLTYAGALHAEAAAKQLEDFFPPQCRQIKVERKAPLTAKERAYWRQFGISDKTLDLYGNVVFNDPYFTKKYCFGDVRPDHLGPMKVTYDTTGMRKLSPMPKPGIHPRMFYTDADRPALLKRYKTTEAGKVAHALMMQYVHRLKGTGPNDKPGNIDQQIWAAYSSGRGEAAMKGKKYQAPAMGALAIEAFHCWLGDDSEGGRKVGTAAYTVLRESLDAQKPDEKPSRNVANSNLNYVYDFVYNWLTPLQRKLMREAIIAENYNRENYGYLQKADATTSNWTTFPTMNWYLAIQGEPGFNSMAIPAMERGFKNFFTYGWFKKGACWEALGKNQIGGQSIFLLSRLGCPIAGHPHLLAYMRNYLPKCILPSGDRIITYDGLGKVQGLNVQDVMFMHYLYPHDKIIDWDYRNAVHDDYSAVKYSTDYPWLGNTALMDIMFLTDYDKANDNPAKLGISRTLFDGHRSIFITRSDWSKSALYLHLHVRGANGGHVFADRNEIMLAGAGRPWFVPANSFNTANYQQNVVNIDGASLSLYAPAKMVQVKHNANASFACGDATWSWNWDVKRLGSDIKANGADIPMNGTPGQRYTLAQAKAGVPVLPKGWTRVEKTINDFAFTKIDLPPFNQPLFERPDWLMPDKIYGFIKRRNALQVKHAFRTAGIVRGKHPYALVVDDIAAADGKDHNYDWLATVPNDVMILSQQTYAVRDGKMVRGHFKPGEPLFTDVKLISAKDAGQLNGLGSTIVPKGAPVLLIRFLQREGTKDPNSNARGHAYITTTVGNHRRLVIRTRSVDPKYKVLLYAYHYGQDPEPTTEWKQYGKSLKIDFGRGEQDVVDFRITSNGRTTCDIKRGGEPLFAFGQNKR